VLAAAACVGAACAGAASGAGGAAVPAAAVPAAAALASYADSIPGTLVTFEMVPVPGGTVTLDGRTVTVKPFWIARTEMTWDAYDPFAFGPGSGGARGSAEAESRPSRPYGAPDYGFGHAGYPVISVARNGAQAFCRWLSEKTGKRYRLPTEAEWVRAAEFAAGGSTTLDAARLDALAWHRGNAGEKSHAVGGKQRDALGLHDLFGNAAEWVMTEGDGRPVTRGGSWRDPADSVGPHARAAEDDSWNERDPQIPKSPWWLSDGPFVGFRVVREP
jgi:formylglycine-generating enzyme required for sulfatase activity